MKFTVVSSLLGLMASSLFFSNSVYATSVPNYYFPAGTMTCEVEFNEQLSGPGSTVYGNTSIVVPVKRYDKDFVIEFSDLKDWKLKSYSTEEPRPFDTEKGHLLNFFARYDGDFGLWVEVKGDEEWQSANAHAESQNRRAEVFLELQLNTRSALHATCSFEKDATQPEVEEKEEL